MSLSRRRTRLPRSSRAAPPRSSRATPPRSSRATPPRSSRAAPPGSGRAAPPGSGRATPPGSRLAALSRSVRPLPHRVLITAGLVALLLITALPASLPGLLAAAPIPGPVLYARVYVDGARVPLPAPAVVAGGFGMAPARALFERFGATVLWDETTQGVTIETADHTISLWIGQSRAFVDGLAVELDTAPFLWFSVTMVPVRFVSETLGLDVAWDASRWAILLTSPAFAAGSPTTPAPEITLAFAGDVLLASSIGRSIAAHGPHYPWDGVRETLSSADIAMVNLESCVSTRGTPVDKRWVFRAAPEALAGITGAGVDLVTTANNHVFDYGLDAFLDTLDYLEQYGIPQTGSGRNLDAALSPVILDANGLRVAFLAATQWFVSAGVASASRPGVCITHYHENRLIDVIRGLKERDEADYIAVNLHWGIEGNHHTDPYQERLGRALIDAGADMIIGHHPHLLQGIEIYNGKLIAYSLGNFVFTYTSRATMDSAILLVTLDHQGLSAIRLVPVYTAAGRPVLEEGEDYVRILKAVEKFSDKWGTLIDANGFVIFP